MQKPAQLVVEAVETQIDGLEMDAAQAMTFLQRAICHARLEKALRGSRQSWSLRFGFFLCDMVDLPGWVRRS